MRYRSAPDTGYETQPLAAGPGTRSPKGISDRRNRPPPIDMDRDEETFMKRALELARRGAGRVSPNPMVGAVLVKDGRVVGQGYHLYDRLRHAESYAIEEAGSLARGSVLYCNLEPCCHHGRTPPCADALVEAGIARAVISVVDPNPQVNHLGIDRLREEGIEVGVGLCENESRRLNEIYIKYVTRRVPFVHSLADDGGGAGLPPGWEPSARLLEALSVYDAVVLGSEQRINCSAITALLGSRRHRPAVIVGDSSALGAPETLAAIEGAASQAKVLLASAEDNSNLERSPDALPGYVGEVRPSLRPVLDALSSLDATSVFVLPGLLRPAVERFRDIDKLTVVTRAGGRAPDAGRDPDVVGGPIRLENKQVWESGDGSIECTGYPFTGPPA